MAERRRAARSSGAAAGPARVAELLLEVRAEELPPRLVEPLLRRFASRLFESLMSRGLGPDELITGGGRRRLTVCCRGLRGREHDRDLRELGPPAAEAWDDDGTPTAALAAFAERLGVAADAVREARTERGRYAAVERHVEGRPLPVVLAELVPELLAELAPGEAIRWAGGTPWVRPVRGLVALLDGEVLTMTFAGIEAGRETAGHPVLSPERFAVDGFDDYRAKLGERGIVLSPGERHARLEAAIRAIAERHRAALPDDDELTAAVARMAVSCEIPGLVDGTIEPDLLAALPPELTLAVLRQHPGALVLRTERGDLAPRFVAVMDRADDPEGRVRAGYERLVKGRLTDARFHLEADRRQPLAARARALDHQAMTPGRGSWGDHQRRVAALARTLAERVEALAPHAAAAEEAAGLLFADRTSTLARDVPALRGVLGGLQAKAEGYVDSVWRAVYEQHRPEGLDDPLPTTPAGRVLAIAARVDRLVAAIGHDGVPAGKDDRHDLRGLALGLVRLLLAGEPVLDVDLVLAHAVLGHGTALARGHADIVADSRRYLLDRARRVFGHQGYAFDEIEAAVAVRWRDLPDLSARIAALHAAREAPYFRDLVEAAKRVSNILADLDERPLDAAALTEDAERTLHELLEGAREAVDEAVAAHRYEDALATLATLAAPVDRFFADVLIMDEDEALRDNRIALLQAVRRAFWSFARLKEMVIE